MALDGPAGQLDLERHREMPATVEAELAAQPIAIEGRKSARRCGRFCSLAVLVAYLFEDLAEAQEITEVWMEEHNGMRPQQALGGQTLYLLAQDGRRDSTFEWP